MNIERLQVEEGFLDGLDVTFAPGLNVIIGARGVGKTSLLELIRYALRLAHVDQRRAADATRHAEAILGGGRVLLTYLDAGTRRTVTRSADDPSSVVPVLSPGQAPVVLSQNELEGIGLDQHSRLRLVDTYAEVDANDIERDVARASAEVGSLTLQLRDLELQREGLRQQELIRPKVEDELAASRARESQLLARAGANAAKIREQLGRATAKSAEIRRELSTLDSARAAFSEVSEQSSSVENAIAGARADVSMAGVPVEEYLEDLTQLAKLQKTVSSALAAVLQRVHDDMEVRRTEIARLNDETRPLRRDFEEFEEGAAAAAQSTARLEQQLADIDAGTERAKAVEERAEGVQRQRDQLMEEIDGVRETLWTQRQEAAEHLSRLFEPRIRIRMEHYGDHDRYVSSLATALRGSGLQHNQLAEWLSQRMSPQELVHAVEAGDASRLAVMGELTSARVEKLVSHLARSESLGDVLISRVDDLAIFELLVGRDYRSSEQLSTGQRCAVVLPLLLADRHRVLLLDQPEDHLDNAYLVDNTIHTLLARSAEAQTIVATHNANIPVLGGAQLVISLGSDGRRGYIRHVGPLMDAPIVAEISSLLEGGAEAFAHRAEFYRRRTESA